MERLSFILAIISVALSLYTYTATVCHEKKKATIDAFNLLQSEVLDKFVCIKKEDAEMIVANLDDKKCKEAYDNYRALIARIEHFAIGVKENVYDFNVADELAGTHLIYLYKKIKPIIDKANKNEKTTKHYCNFVSLVDRLNHKHKILK